MWKGLNQRQTVKSRHDWEPGVPGNINGSQT